MQQPDGAPPDGDDDDFIKQTHCCDDFWWETQYPDETIRAWARWFICGPLGFNITCPGGGGTQQKPVDPT